MPAQTCDMCRRPRATEHDHRTHALCGDYGGGDTVCGDRSCYQLCWGPDACHVRDPYTAA